MSCLSDHSCIQFNRTEQPHAPPSVSDDSGMDEEMSTLRAAHLGEAGLTGDLTDKLDLAPLLYNLAVVRSCSADATLFERLYDTCRCSAIY